MIIEKCIIKYPLYDIRMIRYYDTERSLGLYDNEHDAMSKYNSKIKNLDEYEEKISVVKILNEKLEEENITEDINPKLSEMILVITIRRL